MTIEIHTSDRVGFKRCRRRWNWQSPTRSNLQAISSPIAPLWFGSGMHYVMEDYHGRKFFSSPHDAVEAYFRAFRKEDRPDEWEDLLKLGHSIIAYYTEIWLPRRNEFKTVWIEDQPQVEVQFEVAIPGFDFDTVRYVGTFDRVVQDPFGRLFVMDYKFVKRFDTGKLDIDSQISAYTWAAQQFYGKAFEGVVYVQFRKELAEPPTPLRSGEFSVSKSQGTTWGLYRKALVEAFGNVPDRYVDFLNYLAVQEGTEGDALIRRDVVRRNEYQVVAEESKIVAETHEMTDQSLPLYPNPTRDCSWDCPFHSACVAMDDGSDWEAMIADSFAPRKELHDWRGKITLPENVMRDGQIARMLTLEDF